MARTRLAPELRRAQLIELGLQMLTTRTLSELSVDDIAEQAGISRGLLFHYFRTKQDFELAVAQRAAEDLLACTEPDLALPEDERLRASLTAYVRYVQDNRESYVALVRGAISADADMAEVFETTRSRMAGRVVEQMDTLGLPTGPLAELAVRGWVAFCEECAVRALTSTGPISEDELVDVLTAALPALVLAAVSPGSYDIASLRSS